MALKYYAYFNSTAWAGVTSTRYKIEIYDTAFSGTATEVTTGANPFSEKELNNEETTYGIKSCRFDIDIVSDVVTVEDFYTQEGMSHRVKLYEAPLVGDMTLIRDGYLLSEDVQEVYQDGIKVIQLSGTDGLELLKTIPFEFSADKPYTGVMTALLLLDRCVTPIGLELNVNTSFNYYQNGQSKTASFEPLAFFNVHAPLFKGKTCYEALNMLCETLRCVIFQEDGEWWFIHTLNPDNTTQYYRKWDSDFNSLSNGILPSAITVEFEGEYAPLNGNKLKKRSYKSVNTDVDIQDYINKLRNPDFTSGITEWVDGGVDSYASGGDGTNLNPYYLQINGYQNKTVLDFLNIKYVSQHVATLYDVTTDNSISGKLDTSIKVSGKVLGNGVKFGNVGIFLRIETDSPLAPSLILCLSDSGEWIHLGLTQTVGLNGVLDVISGIRFNILKNIISIPLTGSDGVQIDDWKGFEIESKNISEIVLNMNKSIGFIDNIIGGALEKFYQIDVEDFTKVELYMLIYEGYDNTVGSSNPRNIKYSNLNLEIKDKSRLVGLKKDRYFSEQSASAPNKLEVNAYFSDFQDNTQLVSMLQSDEVTPTILWEDSSGNNVGELMMGLNRELLSLYYKPTSLYDGDILGKVKKYHKINLVEFTNELINLNWNFDFGEGIATGVRYIMTFANYGTFTNTKYGIYSDDKQIKYDGSYPTGVYEFDQVPALKPDLIARNLLEIKASSLFSDGYATFSKINPTSGIQWFDSANNKTDYFLTTEDGFVMKSEISPYEVTLDFTELTANTKLIIPPLSADAYLLTSENGWVLEGNNISTAKKLGSTTAQDWTIIHTDTTIATINSSGINLGENLLTAGGVQFDLTPTQTGAVGKLMWNDTDGTLEFGMKGGNVTQQIGQELPVLVKHADNTGLANGAVVYVVGSDGSNKTVRYALANAESTSSKTFGVMTEDASGGSKAFCTTFGIVRNIDTSALTEGAAVYLSPTVAGGMTTTKPSAPNHMVLVGFCIRSHATLGSIFVKIINGFELNEIHDVAIGTLANNNLLAYESATSLWKNKTYSDLGLVSTASLSPSQLLATDGSTNVVSLSTSTYPSLTELSYVKGVTSSIQTQITAKFTLPSLTSGSVLFSNGTTIAQDNANLFWDDTNNRLGLGTAIPLNLLHINSGAAPALSQMRVTANNLGGVSILNYAAGNSALNFDSDFSGATWVARHTSAFQIYNVGGNLNFNANSGLTVGGAFTPTTRMTLTSTGSVGIGTTVLTGYNLRVSKNITGSVATIAVGSDGVIQSDVTSSSVGVLNSLNTVASSFTLPSYVHFRANQGTIGAGSTVTNQIGFLATANMVGGSNNYGFYGDIPVGTNRWNTYNAGTAQNYFRGNVGIGVGKTIPAYEVDVAGSVNISTANFFRYNVDVGIIGSASSIFTGSTTQLGIRSSSDILFATQGATERMRLNSTGLGINVTNPAYRLDVGGTGHFTGSVTFDTVPSSLQDATSANHLVRYSQFIASTYLKPYNQDVKTVSFTSLTKSGLYAINGYTPTAGQYVLDAFGDSGSGIWVVATGAWTRATDADSDAELRGFVISISQGTYAGYKYYNTNNSTITVGTTAITYSVWSNISELDPVFTSWRDTSRTANTFWAAPSGSSGAATWRTLVASDVPTLNQNTTGNAATATTLQNTRNIAMTGDVAWNVDFNGSADVTAVGTLATVNSNVGTFAGITVNGKGLVTAATALTTLSGYGITDAQSTLVSGTNIKTVGTQSLLGSGDVTLASLNYWTKSGSDVSYIGGNVYAPYFEANGAIVAFASTGTDNYTILGVGSTSFQQKVYDVTNPRLETISSAGVLGTIFNGGNYRFGTGTDSGLAKVQVVGAIQQSSVTNSYIKANASGVLIAGTITTSDVSDLSSYTGFDSRYFTETESDARFVALAGSYANPTWITSLAWSKLTSVPSSFTPSAHTLDSHSNVTITSNSNGEILKWNGSAWINNTLAEAGIQATLSGTGFVKSTSGVISYDTNTYLTGNQTISISGDATGSGATSIAITLANSGVTSGTYRSVTVNAKGLVTGATNPTTISGYGITDFYSQVVSGFVTGANSSVLNTDTLEVALEKLQGQINARISGNQTITLSGIVTGSGTTAITTAIADSALSIAKTSGLQTALDGKFATPSGLTTNYVSKWNGTGFSNSQIFDNGTNVGIGTTSLAGYNLRVNKPLTGNGGTSAYGVSSDGVIQNDITTTGRYFFTTGQTAASTTLTHLVHYETWQGTFGAGSVVSNQTGFWARESLTGASNNYGFRGAIPSGTNRWNAFMDGTAQNYFRGNVGIGVGRTVPAYELDVVGTIRTTSLMITSGAAVGSFLKANNVNGTSVWASITTSDISNLSSWTGSTSITTLGTIGTGTWNGTTISTAKGGTGLTTLGTANQLLRVNSGATALEYFTPTYISGNQTITLSGVVTGSGTTAITTSIANGAITNAMLANTAVANLSGTNTGDNSPNSLYSGLVSNATHTGDATGATSLTVVGIRGVSLPTLGVTAGFLRYTGTGTNTWVFDTSTYLTANQSISITGDATGTGTTSIALTLANVATAGTYRSVTINSKGLVTSGTNPTTISGYGITDFYSQVVSGFVTGANSTVLNTDTLEVALEKLQGQINARISGNQTITLSGVITGSGTTAITTSIADATLSIAKTSGLQTALDAKMATASYPDLVAIEALTGTSGFLKKTAANTWELDTNTYLTASLTSTYIGYGSSVNTLTGNSTFTYLDNRYIHLTSSGSNFNLGTFSSAGFIESVNGNLLLQARSTFGVVVDDGFFQVNDLSGSGTRMVVASSTGVLSTQTIPSGGGVPVLAATQIGFGDGSNLMTSSANFVYDNGSLVLTNTTSANTNVIRINGSDGYDKNIFFSEVGGTNYGAYVGYRAGVNGSPDPTMLVMQTINNDSVMGGIAIHRQNGHVYIGLTPNAKAWNSDELNYNKLFVDGNMRVGGNEIIISGTSFKLDLDDAWGGTYTPSTGDKCTLTYDSSKAAFVLQKMNTYNDGTRTFLIL